MKHSLKRLETHEIFNMVKFIVNENFNHHMYNASKQHYTSEVNTLYDEELTYYQNSKIYIERDSYGSILGSIRVLKWNFVDTLPIQKLFGINPLYHMDLTKVNDVFHFGRLAIQKSYPSLQLFKKLIAIAIAPICQDKQNVAFAECDAKLLRVLSLLGITSKMIGKPIHYLGSETIPIMITYDDLIDFHLKNKGIYESEDQMTPERKNQYVPELTFEI